MPTARLNRTSWPAPPRPVRIVHIGIGSFSRAHQAWYTMTADPAREWGIAAFTGRRPDVANALGPQQGLYTLIERGPARDRLEVIDVLSEVHAGADVDAVVDAIASHETAVVTLTITEAGYRPSAAATPAAADADGEPPTVPGRLALGLAERRRRGGAPLAIVSCDNLHANGEVLRRRVLAEAAPEVADWIEREVSFVSTSVDRITPRTSAEDRRLVERELGLADAAPVVCEPFTDWVLCGEFPAGRPAWERAGARFVSDIEPWELRKLWLLNGGHSLLAYLGLARGYQTVAEAVGDAELVGRLEAFWDLAERHLPTGAELDRAAYRRQLLDRFRNARIGYPLAQIAQGGLDKLRQRVAPVILAARAAGEPAEPAMVVAEAWARWEGGGDERMGGLLELLGI